MVAHTVLFVTNIEMNYRLKASWVMVICNMQILITYLFDVQVMGVKFETHEFIGCGIMLIAVAYLGLIPEADPETRYKTRITRETELSHRGSPVS